MRLPKYQVYDRKFEMMFDVTEITQLDHSVGFVKGVRGDTNGEYYVTSGYLNKKIGIGKNGTGPVVDRFVLREYTGMDDVNKDEIYEYDEVICLIPESVHVVVGDGYQDTQVVNEKTVRGTVRFIHSMWFIDSGDGTGIPLEFDDNQILTVVGFDCN